MSQLTGVSRHWYFYIFITFSLHHTLLTRGLRRRRLTEGSGERRNHLCQRVRDGVSTDSVWTVNNRAEAGSWDKMFHFVLLQLSPVARVIRLIWK